MLAIISTVIFDRKDRYMMLRTTSSRQLFLVRKDNALVWRPFAFMPNSTGMIIFKNIS